MATPHVYVGGSNETTWRHYRRNDEDWVFVRENADGWYINNFAMKQPNIEALVRETAERFTNKRVFYETDLEFSSDSHDETSIAVLSEHFTVTNCCVNRAAKKDITQFAKRRDILKKGNSSRPVQVQIAPWQIKGDFSHPSNSDLQEVIKHAQGSATDGPLTLWKENGDFGRGNMRIRPGAKIGGSASTVEWVRKLNPNFQTMIMLAPITQHGQEFFDAVVDCVRMHERFNASPDVWALSFYGPPCFHLCPVLPDSWFDTGAEGACRRPPQYPWSARKKERKPAETFMGAAFWLINHLREPSNWP